MGSAARAIAWPTPITDVHPVKPPGALLIGLTGFEIMVAFLQAFIFALLTAVYIGGALHPEH